MYRHRFSVAPHLKASTTFQISSVEQLLSVNSLFCVQPSYTPRALTGRTMSQFVAPGIGGGTEYAALLNFDGDAFDVALLDRVCAAFYDPSAPQHALAGQALLALQNHPRAWSRVAVILERGATQTQARLPATYTVLRAARDHHDPVAMRYPNE